MVLEVTIVAIVMVLMWCGVIKCNVMWWWLWQKINNKDDDGKIDLEEEYETEEKESHDDSDKNDDRETEYERNRRKTADNELVNSNHTGRCRKK